jgi:hypothetical protein
MHGMTKADYNWDEVDTDDYDDGGGNSPDLQVTNGL